MLFIPFATSEGLDIQSYLFHANRATSSFLGASDVLLCDTWAFHGSMAPEMNSIHRVPCPQNERLGSPK